VSITLELFSGDFSVETVGGILATCWSDVRSVRKFPTAESFRPTLNASNHQELIQAIIQTFTSNKAEHQHLLEREWRAIPYDGRASTLLADVQFCEEAYETAQLWAFLQRANIPKAKGGVYHVYLRTGRQINVDDGEQSRAGGNLNRVLTYRSHKRSGSESLVKMEESIKNEESDSTAHPIGNKRVKKEARATKRKRTVKAEKAVAVKAEPEPVREEEPVDVFDIRADLEEDLLAPDGAEQPLPDELEDLDELFNVYKGTRSAAKEAGQESTAVGGEEDEA
jgi:hypothetical protein